MASKFDYRIKSNKNLGIESGLTVQQTSRRTIVRSPSGVMSAREIQRLMIDLTSHLKADATVVELVDFVQTWFLLLTGLLDESSRRENEAAVTNLVQAFNFLAGKSRIDSYIFDSIRIIVLACMYSIILREETHRDGTTNFMRKTECFSCGLNHYWCTTGEMVDITWTKCERSASFDVIQFSLTIKEETMPRHWWCLYNDNDLTLRKAISSFGAFSTLANISEALNLLNYLEEHVVALSHDANKLTSVILLLFCKLKAVCMVNQKIQNSLSFLHLALKKWKKLVPRIIEKEMNNKIQSVLSLSMFALEDVFEHRADIVTWVERMCDPVEGYKQLLGSFNRDSANRSFSVVRNETLLMDRHRELAKQMTEEIGLPGSFLLVDRNASGVPAFTTPYGFTLHGNCLMSNYTYPHSTIRSTLKIVLSFLDNSVYTLEFCESTTKVLSRANQQLSVSELKNKLPLAATHLEKMTRDDFNLYGVSQCLMHFYLVFLGVMSFSASFAICNYWLQLQKVVDDLLERCPQPDALIRMSVALRFSVVEVLAKPYSICHLSAFDDLSQILCSLAYNRRAQFAVMDQVEEIHLRKIEVNKESGDVYIRIMLWCHECVNLRMWARIEGTRISFFYTRLGMVPVSINQLMRNVLVLMQALQADVTLFRRARSRILFVYMLCCCCYVVNKLRHDPFLLQVFNKTLDDFTSGVPSEDPTVRLILSAFHDAIVLHARGSKSFTDILLMFNTQLLETDDPAAQEEADFIILFTVKDDRRMRNYSVVELPDRVIVSVGETIQNQLCSEEHIFFDMCNHACKGAPEVTKVTRIATFGVYLVRMKLTQVHHEGAAECMQTVLLRACLTQLLTWATKSALDSTKSYYQSLYSFVQEATLKEASFDNVMNQYNLQVDNLTFFYEEKLGTKAQHFRVELYRVEASKYKVQFAQQKKLSVLSFSLGRDAVTCRKYKMGIRYKTMNVASLTQKLNQSFARMRDVGYFNGTELFTEAQLCLLLLLSIASLENRRQVDEAHFHELRANLYVATELFRLGDFVQHLLVYVKSTASEFFAGKSDRIAAFPKFAIDHLTALGHPVTVEAQLEEEVAPQAVEDQALGIVSIKQARNGDFIILMNEGQEMRRIELVETEGEVKLVYTRDALDFLDQKEDWLDSMDYEYVIHLLSKRMTNTRVHLFVDEMEDDLKLYFLLRASLLKLNFNRRKLHHLKAAKNACTLDLASMYNQSFQQESIIYESKHTVDALIHATNYLVRNMSLDDTIAQNYTLLRRFYALIRDRNPPRPVKTARRRAVVAVENAIVFVSSVKDSQMKLMVEKDIGYDGHRARYRYRSSDSFGCSVAQKLTFEVVQTYYTETLDSFDDDTLDDRELRKLVMSDAIRFICILFQVTLLCLEEKKAFEDLVAHFNQTNIAGLAPAHEAEIKKIVNTFVQMLRMRSIRHAYNGLERSVDNLPSDCFVRPGSTYEH